MLCHIDANEKGSKAQVEHQQTDDRDTIQVVYEPKKKKQKKREANEVELHTSKQRKTNMASKKAKLQHIHVQDRDNNLANPELSIITTKSWKGLLWHRMAPRGFLNVVERLDHDQWIAITPTGFGGMLAVRTRLIPK